MPVVTFKSYRLCPMNPLQLEGGVSSQNLGSSALKAAPSSGECAAGCVSVGGVAYEIFQVLVQGSFVILRPC